MLVGEERAGASDSGLHLVEDQQKAVVVAKLAHGFKEIPGGHADATLALNRLDHDRRRMRPDGCFPSRDVV